MPDDKTRTKTYASVSKEKDLALVIRDLGNERLNTPKKLVPVRPKAALGIRKKKRRKEWQLQSLLRYTQTHKKCMFMKNMVSTRKLATGRCSKQ